MSRESKKLNIRRCNRGMRGRRHRRHKERTSLIESDISGNAKATRSGVIAPIAFVLRVVSKKDTWNRLSR